MGMSNEAQVAYWNDAAGVTWARFWAQLDKQVAPLGAEAMRALGVKPGERVLDIGCGCGQTGFELAALTGEAGAVRGVDISRPMLEIARARPERPEWLAFDECDAQTGDLGHGIYDAAYSRFGVMFFSDPEAAFRNILRALKPGGRLAFVCWRGLAENVWMREPMAAAAHLLPPQPPAEPYAPGPFAFADAGRVLKILLRAGFHDVTERRFDTGIGGLSLDEAVDVSLRVGPLGAALRAAPEHVKAAAAVLRELLARYLTPDGVVMPAAVWIVRAHA
jgi:SAM-dependent methyltransferase